MPQPTDVANVCCVAIELSKSSWVIAFSPPADCGKASVHQIAAKDINRLLSFLESARSKAEREASRPLEIVVCYEVGYDGFWLARVLIARGIRTIVFDPASFLMPRKGRRAKTDRLDAEGMTRTLRAWLSGDREVARDVRIPTVEEEDAKRIERERKHLVEQRTSVVGRIKGLLALHGIHLSGKRIGTGLQGRLDHIKTGDGRNLAPFLRRDLERMLRHYEFICDQIKDNIDYIFGLAGNAALDALVAGIADNSARPDAVRPLSRGATGPDEPPTRQINPQCVAQRVDANRSRRTDRWRACASPAGQKREAWCMIQVSYPLMSFVKHRGHGWDVLHAAGVKLIRVDRAEERAGPEDVGDQALMRGLDTAFPFVRPGLSLSGVGRRSCDRPRR